MEKIPVNEVYHVDFLSILLRKGVMFFFRRQNKQPPSLHVSTCLSSSTGRVTYVNIRKPNNNIPYFNQQSALIKVQSVHFQPSLIIIIFIYCNWVVKKILSTPSFGGEIKPSVPCPRFAACKRSINLRGSRNLGKITGKISRPQFHLFATRISRVVADVQAPGGESKNV